ncbi:unnamed protein product [Protopolystoma xenopodis]|uniref:Dynein heavy chain 3 AAA+ lid domain-containing protein n=1 Tax=Protopolystoma xenopodis TaxID=117903 RepID=A0A448WH92_9PLAT|nr:unnamed protein product [Protopolystoma xenopodis]
MQVDEYGTQQPIALMRLLIGRGGLYDQIAKEMSWRRLKDTTYLGSMGPPGGGRHALDPRFVSLFSVFHALCPSNDSMFTIFGGILFGHMANGFTHRLINEAPTFTLMSIKAYQTVRNRLLPTPTKFHYTFNLRDIFRLFQGLCFANPERFKGPKKFLRLWRHECIRVFEDRMNCLQDREIVSVSLIKSIFSRKQYKV